VGELNAWRPHDQNLLRSSAAGRPFAGAAQSRGGVRGMKSVTHSAATPLPPALAALLRELLPFGGEQTVGPLRAALIALADEALEVDDAAALEFVLSRIACQPRSLGARMEAIADILGQRGNVVVTLTRDNYSIQRPA
jgi:hypothetical protein